MFLRFGSWIGGDRDGHPHVTTEVTAQTLIWLRQAAVDAHLTQARQMSEFLSISENEATVPVLLKQQLTDALVRWPDLAGSLEHVASMETYRRWLAVIEWRLERSTINQMSQELPAGAYRDGTELEADIQKLLDGLSGNPSERLQSTRCWSGSI